MKAIFAIPSLALLLFSGVAVADPFFGYGWGGGILGLIILILDIIAIIEVLGSSRPAVEKLLWVVVILALPVIGLILYYLLGKR